tara:strand:+ start:17011 stop:20382 length:3372 start_codon:yes stop_codon:yes gene_type:complete
MTTKILIIDDDQYTRQVLAKILVRDRALARYKPQVIEAADGEAGIQAFLEHKPQLAIVDLFMPKMDGFAVCKALREIASPAELTIAVTSGVYKDPSIAANLESEFGARFFAKPYQLKNIATFVAKALAPPPRAATEPSAANAVAPKGELSPEVTAAHLFWSLMEREATGRLVLRKGHVVRQIELFVGHPVKVTTNVREETLGNFLVLRGRIDKETQRAAMARAAGTGKRLGETFIAMGVLTPQSLISELTAQTRFKLANALRWTDGEWVFQDGAPRNSMSNALDFAEVIVAELAKTTQVQSPTAAIKDLAHKPLSGNKRGSALLKQIALSISPQFAKHFRADITIEELRLAGVSRAHIYRSLDVLQSCGGLLVGAADSIPVAIATAESEAIQLAELTNTKVADVAEANLYAGLFDHEPPAGARSGSHPIDQLGTEQPWKAKGPSPANETDYGSDTIEDIEITLSESEADQNFDEDSVVSVSFSTIGPDEGELARRHDLLQEFLRIHETSLYEVLAVSATATSAQIQAAFDTRSKAFSKTVYTAKELGRDYAKLNMVLTSYQQALDTLLDQKERQRYDDNLYAATQDLPNAPSMNAGIAFQEAEECLASSNYEGAIAKLQSAIAISPSEPAYHATLGWALFLHGGQDELAADAARSHINEALAMAPDSGLVHEYKGLVHAKLGDDPEAALQHLLKALDADPRRVGALAAIEALYLTRGEHRQLDQLYRRLLFHIGQRATAEGAVLWRRMGDLHRHYLRSPDQALIAYREALKRCPEDAELKALCNELATGGLGSFFETTDALLSQWRDAPTNFAPIGAMYQLAAESNQFDGQHLAASALTLANQATVEQQENYQRFRPRFLLRAQRTVDNEAWEQLLHKEDYSLIGALYALLADVIAELHPQKRADEEVSQADELSNATLSEEFRSTRTYVANVLGVPEPVIYSRVDYGQEIHVASLPTPVLLAGYDAVTCTDKLELACRLARAMSYLKPGRAIAAGCPSRVLKHAMMACYSLGAPSANIPDPDGSVAEFRDAILRLDQTTQYQALELVAHISQEQPSLNLSRWTRVLARTADRCGLLICGDLAMSMACLGQPLGSAPGAELLEFALSSQHMRLRAAMGLSINV